MAKDLSTLSGKWGWVWELQHFGNSVQNVINLAKHLGLKGIKVKCAEGGDPFWPQYEQFIQPCKDKGLELAAWIFNYPENTEAQAQNVKKALDLGATHVCLDVENQFANKKDEALQLVQQIRALCPDQIITFSPWCMVDAGVWAEVPYDVIAPLCDAVEPQNYWSNYGPKCDVGLKESDKQLKKYNLPIYPIGQTYVPPNGGYEPTAADYVLFEKTCHAIGYSGVSFFSLDGMNQVMIDSVAKIDFTPPVTQLNDKYVTHTELASALENLANQFKN